MPKKSLPKAPAPSPLDLLKDTWEPYPLRLVEAVGGPGALDFFGDQSLDMVLLVKDADTWEDFFAALLVEGQRAWRDDHRPPADPPVDLTWKQFRVSLLKAGWRAWSKTHHLAQTKKVGRPGERSRCFNYIRQELCAALKKGHYELDRNGQPLFNGQRRTQGDLMRMIQKYDPDLNDASCRNYARLWELREQILRREPLTKSNGNFLRQHDRPLYELLCGNLPKWFENKLDLT